MEKITKSWTDDKMWEEFETKSKKDFTIIKKKEIINKNGIDHRGQYIDIYV